MALVAVLRSKGGTPSPLENESPITTVRVEEIGGGGGIKLPGGNPTGGGPTGPACKKLGQPKTRSPPVPRFKMVASRVSPMDRTTRPPELVGVAVVI